MNIADEKESLNPVTETTVEKQKNQDVNLLQEEGELSPKHDDIPNNSHKAETEKLERSANQRLVSDDSNYSRFQFHSHFLQSLVSFSLFVRSTSVVQIVLRSYTSSCFMNSYICD